MNRHTTIHTGDMHYNCAICKKDFTQYYSWKDHLRRHITQKCIRCHICNKSFTLQQSLKRHLLLHENVRPFKCNICNKSYVTLSILKRHQETHSKEICVCNICDRTFSNTDAMNCHKLIHNKKYSCGICNKCFVTPGMLTKHMANAVKNSYKMNYSYHCDNCNRVLTSSTYTSSFQESDLQMWHLWKGI